MDLASPAGKETSVTLRRWGWRPVTCSRRKSLASVALGVVAGLLVSACGSNGEAAKSPQQILRDTASALTAVKSYEIQGKVPTGTGLGTFTFKVAGANLGEGSFTLGSLSFQLEEIRGTDYIRSSSLWAGVGGGALQGLLANRWVSVPANNPLAQQLTNGVAALTSAKQTAASFTKADTKATRGHTSTFDGQGVVAVTNGTSTIFVATSGQPWPIRVTASGGSYLNLSNFNASFGVTAPKPSVSLLDVIAGLGAGLGSQGRA